MKASERREAVLELYGQLIEANSVIAQAEKVKGEIKGKLALLIPPSQSVGGIRHTVVESKRTKWKDVSEAAKVTLVPRTRWGDYEQLVYGNTSVSVYDKFSEVEEA